MAASAVDFFAGFSLLISFFSMPPASLAAPNRDGKQPAGDLEGALRRQTAAGRKVEGSGGGAPAGPDAYPGAQAGPRWVTPFLHSPVYLALMPADSRLPMHMVHNELARPWQAGLATHLWWDGAAAAAADGALLCQLRDSN